MEKIKSIVCLVTVFLILVVPNVSAIEYNSANEIIEYRNKWSTDINIEELRDAILDRIKELDKTCNSTFQYMLYTGIFKDPDGPFEGGLDDISDWGNFIYAVGQTILMTGITISLPSMIPYWIELLNSEDFESVFFGILWILIGVIDFTFVPISIIKAYGDAFDIIDPDEDGF
jgi:hypothetical protein